MFLFPVLPSYTLTHQWLRELARRPGSRGLVAVHVRLPDDEPVTVGRYSDHQPPQLSAAEARGDTAALREALRWPLSRPASTGVGGGSRSGGARGRR